MKAESFIAMAADIVSAHVSRNIVDPDRIPSLIKTVYGSLSSLGGDEPEAPIEKPKPAASIRSSVKPTEITCLECGGKFKILKRHLGSGHDLTPAEYRARWKLPADYPMIAPEYAQKRKDLAIAIGLGHLPQKRRMRAKARTASNNRKKLGIVTNAS